jgi:hypothetical protein
VGSDAEPHAARRERIEVIVLGSSDPIDEIEFAGSSRRRTALEAAPLSSRARWI